MFKYKWIFFVFLFGISHQDKDDYRKISYKVQNAKDVSVCLEIKKKDFIPPNILYVDVVSMNFLPEAENPEIERTKLRLKIAEGKCRNSFKQYFDTNKYGKILRIFKLSSSINGTAFDEFKLDTVGQINKKYYKKLVSVHNNLVMNVVVVPGPTYISYKPAKPENTAKLLRNFKQNSTCLFIYSLFGSRSVSLYGIPEEIARLLFLMREIKFMTSDLKLTNAYETLNVWPYECQNKNAFQFNVTVSDELAYIDFYFYGIWNSTVYKRDCWWGGEVYCSSEGKNGLNWDFTVNMILPSQNLTLKLDEVFALNILKSETFVCAENGNKRHLTKFSYDKEDFYYSYFPYIDPRSSSIREWKPWTKEDFQTDLTSQMPKCIKAEN